MSRPLTPANEPPKAAAPDPQTFIRALAAYLAKPVGGAATPNRVNQLDALEIDGQILHSLWESLGEVFHGHLQGVSLRLQAELRAALRFLYFYWSVWQDRPSPGNTYQNLRYTSADGASMVSPELLPPLSRMQKLITGVVYVGLRYMSERLDRSDEFLLRYATARRAMAFTESLVRLADALNYVLFLYDGRYRSPLDRMLGMQLCYQRDGAVRNLNFELLNRQLVWEGFTDFLLFLLPLLESRPLQEFQRVWSASLSRDARSLGGEHDSEPSTTTCAACGSNKPLMPHRAKPCGHAFCYACISVELSSRSRYRCPRCRSLVDGCKRLIDK
ncbi:hypothetical protein CDCA_CDCA17G4346 [Cyanidium caldarium]|uniref:RING-type E3 ubiquitin transferase (cysteine targeting) n=1 Tax=Cyanidium caldarium TaxID=2771 RepID=A0AAV9J1N3_CYACA|nr:hypothetical protein CDCA_CDCA17G4346 [Cyanidium caldarium]